MILNECSHCTVAEIRVAHNSHVSSRNFINEREDGGKIGNQGVIAEDEATYGTIAYPPSMTRFFMPRVQHVQCPVVQNMTWKVNAL